MAFDNLLVTREGHVALITVNRPAVLNALNAATMGELRQALLDARHDDDVRVVLLTGTGEKAFVAGADINEVSKQTPASGREMALRGQHVLDLLQHLGKPSIAVINGFALGGGCELALACTFRLMAETARLGQPEINLGIIPGYAGTQRLVRLVGPDRALDLVLTGRHVGADEAFRMGLVTRVVSASSLMDEARSFANELAAKPPIAVRYAIDAVHRGGDMPFADACAYEAALFALSTATEDMKEGTRAFLEKRKADFRGQ